MTACAVVRGRLPELALGVLDGAEREDLLRHLEGCPRCRAELGELAGVVDGLVHLGPEVEPPGGFQGRVLTAMGARPARRPDRRRARLRAIAAVVVAGLVVVGAGVALGSGGPEQEAVAPAVLTVPMLDGHRVAVGNVVVDHDQRSLAVSIDYAIPDGTYTLALRAGPAPVRTIAALTVVDGQGAWRGAVRLPHTGAVTLSMLDQSAATVCQAALGAGEGSRGGEA